METDKHLKVRTHAALTLKTITAVGECDDHLPAVFAGSLRALHDCQQRRVVMSDPAQMRFAAALEAALRALALKILLDLVLGDGNTSARNSAPVRFLASPAHDRWIREADCKARNTERCTAGRDFRERQEAPAVEAGGTDAYQGRGEGAGESAESSEVGDLDSGAKDSTRATLILREHADDLLELVASREAVTALSLAELLPYRRHVPREFYTALGIGESDVSESIAVEPPAAAILLAQSILYTASEALLRLFDGEGVGVVGSGSEGPVASRQSWQACAAEASRRRLRVIGYFRDTAAVGEQERSQGTLLFDKFPGCRLAGGGVIDHDDEM